MKQYNFGMYINNQNWSKEEFEDFKLLVTETFSAENIKKFGEANVSYIGENNFIMIGIDYSEETPFLFLESITNEKGIEEYVQRGLTNIIQTYSQGTFLSSNKENLGLNYK